METKKEKRIKAKQELDKRQQQRKKEIENRKKMNLEQEADYHKTVQIERNGPNPWDRVVANCEMNSAQYVGGADVTRMRQAMIARKGDITKAGGMSKSML